ncbi:hypothetical protein AGMMS49592_0530 [Endomicrobiia bacterium]|nr:hypothetical protein AGMMS49592_0530 [Endomicrobiia bacterium]
MSMMGIIDLEPTKKIYKQMMAMGTKSFIYGDFEYKIVTNPSKRLWNMSNHTDGDKYLLIKSDYEGNKVNDILLKIRDWTFIERSNIPK